MTIPRDERPRTRNDLAWSISVGGIGIVLFAAMLVFSWYFATTLLLIFTGMLLGVGLNALTNALGRRAFTCPMRSGSRSSAPRWP
ncbi:hypothetical protein ACVWW3_002823 [Bradyrhizobium sp. LM2.9]